MSGTLAEFHFLRPEWLWLVAPAAVVVWLIGRSEDPLRPFKGLIAPHLLPHLLVGEGRGFRIRPAHLAGVFLAVALVALAGPTWQREVPPFAQDEAALVVALDLSRSMDAIDVQPSRLVRAQQKVRDLLALRRGARTALVVYAGTAHTVLPLTEDAAILEVYLEALATSAMPVPGKDAPAALDLAESLLAKEPMPGTILFVTDGIAVAQVPAFAAHRQRSSHQVVALGVGTTEGGPIREGKGFLSEGGHRVVAKLGKEGLEILARDAGAFVATATVDDRDVRRIQRSIQTHLQEVTQKDQSARYRDFGAYLVPLLAVMGGLWFRRGWTIRGVAVLLIGAFPAGPAEASDWRFADLWATRDQQGRYSFERGDYKTAAERFQDRLWKGIACYRAADYACAVDALARVDSPLAWYDLGNAYAKTGELKLAVAAYDKALAGRRGWPRAKANRDLVAALIPSEKKDDAEQSPADPTQKPDEVKLDEQGKKGKAGRVEVPQLTDEQIAEMWLRAVQASPADFLRLKFAEQARERKPPDPRKGKVAP
jgi:Ca-activated chloride channel family protein